MRVEVAEPHVLNEAERRDILDVFLRIADGWHSWSGPDPNDAGLKRLFAEMPLARELLEKSYAAAKAYSVPGNVVRLIPDAAKSSVIEASSIVEIPVSQCRGWICEPLEIWVENGRNDASFLRSVFRVISKTLNDSLDSRHPPLTIEHGGGKGEVFKLLHDRGREEQKRGNQHRRVVLVDSDSNYRGHQSTAPRPAQDLLESGVVLFVHVLERRAIENYVGVIGLHRFAKLKGSPEVAASAKFILSLTPEQRSYYPIKKGIKADSLGFDYRGNPRARLYQGVTFPEPSASLDGLFQTLAAEEDLADLLDLADEGVIKEFSEFCRLVEEWI